MSTRQYLIDRLSALCALHGTGVVAEAIGKSEEYLTQLMKGTKLQESGNQRGIGPSVLSALDKHYPGWSGATGPLMRAFFRLVRIF